MLLSYFATLPIAMQHNWQHLLLPPRVTIWASARAYFVKQKPSPNQKDMLHYKLIFFQMVIFFYTGCYFVRVYIFSLIEVEGRPHDK